MGFLRSGKSASTGIAKLVPQVGDLLYPLLAQTK